MGLMVNVLTAHLCLREDCRITCSYAINAEDIAGTAEATTEEGAGGGDSGANAMHFYSLTNPGQRALSVTDLHDT